ncbi:MAG: hypothetical protein KatS3mg054_0793 [Chloroflexus sp.]|jgi:hypothetical protein|nr:MAG: hypothetical protein KatS3mg054_0793 [Chloroflexus sp.]GIV92935.1 MAG: hypothetical protein KatS3mg056_1644 [Chloroflexus sp.]
MVLLCDNRLAVYQAFAVAYGEGSSMTSTPVLRRRYRGCAIP